MRDYPHKDFPAYSFERHTLDNAQDKRHDTSNEAYDLSSIAEGEIKIARISGSTYLYTRKDDQVSRVLMTDV